ncbi:cation:proton antiporter [Sphingorhabdus arenilitoris]|uniref:Cation:proton antiporter n=1 Tax=Sphingorhabdus arenilitoris TaxID=1490041 RepID=A0ABV8RIY0_9SPHN
MHPVTTTELFLLAMLIIYCLPYLVWRLGRTEYYAPLVVVQIVAGILLGPGVLGGIFPSYYQTIFTPDVIKMLSGLATWAVMLFVWIAGIELELHKAKANARETAVTAGLAMIVPMALGSLVAAGLLNSSNIWAGNKGNNVQVILGLGMSCAVTALPILILFMEKLEILRAPLGQRILRYASLDDIAIWGVLALILLDWERIGRQAVFLVAFIIAAFLIRKLMEALQERDRWPVSLVWLAAVALGADWCGLHFMVGAFLAGMVLEARWFNQERMDLFRHYILLAFMPVFFLSTGLRTQWESGGVMVFAAAAALLVAAIAGKLAGVHLAGRILKWQKGEASIIGWLLQTKALIMIIFANVLLDKQIISNTSFTALLLMAVGSTMLTIPMVTPRLAKLKSLIVRDS